MSKIALPFVLVSLVLPFAVAGCGGGGGGIAPKKAVATDPDPNFVLYPDSVPGQYIATYAKGAYKEPTDTSEGNGVAVATAICAKYGATLSEAYTYAGSFSFESDEKTARAMSHDSRVDGVESDAIVTGAAAKKP